MPIKLTDAQAQQLGITKEQIKEARLRPATARLPPPAPPAQAPQKAPPSPGTIDGYIGNAPAVVRWLKAELQARFPGEAQITRLGLEFLRIKFRVEVDAWSDWNKREPASDEFADWVIFRLTSSALQTKTAQREALGAITKYAKALGLERRKACNNK